MSFTTKYAKGKTEEINIQNYRIVSVNDYQNTQEIYESEKRGHTDFFNLTDDILKESARKITDVIEEEYNFKRSRFYKNWKGLPQQTSSGISQVLKKIEDSSIQTSDAVYANAIDEATLKEKFPDFITTQDPLSQDQKLRIHEALQADGAVMRACSFWRKFSLGKSVIPDFKIKKELDPMLSDAIDERLQLHPDITKYKNQLRDIDDEVDLRRSVQNIVDNLLGYGRAVLVILFNEDKLPVRLVPLSSFKLGRVYMDKNTFEFIGVEYLEIPDKNNILLATDMIYFTINDNNVTPNSRYYGRSLIFPVISIAENNLINKERNFPEIIRRRWAATLLIKTNTRSPKRNQQIANDVNQNAGGSVVIPDLVSAENIKMDTELTSLIDYSREMDKKIFRDMELPLKASGIVDSGGTTAADAQAEISIWSESTLDDFRENIEDTLVKQYYNRNLRKIIETDVIANGTTTDFEPPPVFDPAQAKIDQQEHEAKAQQEQQQEQQQVNPFDKQKKPPVEGEEEEEEEEKKPTEPEPQPEEEEEENIVEPVKETNDSILDKQKLKPDKELTLFQKLGFDLDAMEDAQNRVKAPDEDTLQKWVIEKLTNIAKDIYKDILEVTFDDIISLTQEIKFPFLVYLKYVNIKLDSYLDRAAGTLGIFSAGVINRDISLELMGLEKYIPVMRREELKEQKLKLKQMAGKLAVQAKAINALGGNPNIAINGQPKGLEEEDPDKIEKQQQEQNAGNPTDAGIAAKNKVSGRLAQRTNRGRVG